MNMNNNNKFSKRQYMKMQKKKEKKRVSLNYQSSIYKQESIISCKNNIINKINAHTLLMSIKDGIVNFSLI